MNTIVRRLTSVALLAFALPALAQQQLALPSGIVIELPEGWQALPHESGQFQLLPPDASPTEALLLLTAPSEGVQTATDPSVLADSETEVRKLFPAMRRLGPPQRMDTALGEAVQLGFGGSVDGTTVQLALFLVVHEGTAVSLMAAGTRQDVSPRLGELAAVFASLQLDAGADQAPFAGSSAPAPSPPAAAVAGGIDDGSAIARPWAQRLSGRKLVVMSGYSSGGSGGMNSRYDLELHADGRFHYYGSSSVSISVEGLGGSSSSQEDERGRWRVITHQGSAVLELSLDSGARQYGELGRNGEQTLLNGSRVFVTDI
ncbi:MAG: hypothetical protein MEQ07_02855 [Aquimonas sp.]|nr:hypothetical protein [Aquimonas sp.]